MFCFYYKYCTVTLEVWFLSKRSLLWERDELKEIKGQYIIKLKEDVETKLESDDVMMLCYCFEVREIDSVVALSCWIVVVEIGLYWSAPVGLCFSYWFREFLACFCFYAELRGSRVS